jgi:hypothetical protein
MAKATSNKTGRRGLPAPSTVIAQFTLAPFSPEAAPGTPGAAAPAGNAYRVLRTNQVDEYEQPGPAAEAPAAMAPAGDQFAGTARKAAKLSVGSGKLEEFADVKQLIGTLPSEAAMKKHKPAITTTAASKRVAEEQRNVKVRGYLYAASREADNDFHLIVGRDPKTAATYMTMEVSGLPPASNSARTSFKRARDAYKAFFGHQPNGLPGTGYDFYDPPIPVEIEGSLFFDMSHATGGRPGPPDLRGDMPTIWEVHPVTSIVFEP